ncbi:MAG: hypothetical protein GX616_24980, partial [Planctomycetes bacterium]|nr:hypothetical protein [Planctomycetota bacterium]
MPRTRRKRRMLKWAGLVLSLLIAVAWVVSFRWCLEYRQAIRRGAPPATQQALQRVLKSSHSGQSVRCREVRLSRGRSRCGTWVCRPWELGWQVRVPPASPWWRPYYHRSAGGTLVLIPLWMPFLIVALPTGLLWWRGRSRIPPGHCQKCGYNLTGNVSGV